MWSQYGGNFTILWPYTVNIYDNSIVKVHNIVDHFVTIYWQYCHNTMTILLIFHNMMNNIANIFWQYCCEKWQYCSSYWEKTTIILSSYCDNIVQPYCQIQNTVIIYANHMWLQYGAISTILWANTVYIYDNRIVEINNMVDNIVTIRWQYCQNAVTILWVFHNMVNKYKYMFSEINVWAWYLDPVKTSIEYL